MDSITKTAATLLGQFVLETIRKNFAPFSSSFVVNEFGIPERCMNAFVCAVACVEGHYLYSRRYDLQTILNETATALVLGDEGLWSGPIGERMARDASGIRRFFYQCAAWDKSVIIQFKDRNQPDDICHYRDIVRRAFIDWLYPHLDVDTLFILHLRDRVKDREVLYQEILDNERRAQLSDELLVALRAYVDGVSITPPGSGLPLSLDGKSLSGDH
jgi:hypothetical protein